MKTTKTEHTESQRRDAAMGFLEADRDASLSDVERLGGPDGAAPYGLDLYEEQTERSGCEDPIECTEEDFAWAYAHLDE
jgi:hypothetical protein